MGLDLESHLWLNHPNLPQSQDPHQSFAEFRIGFSSWSLAFMEEQGVPRAGNTQSFSSRQNWARVGMFLRKDGERDPEWIGG